MKNIEYNSIVQYIEQDIIGQAIHSNSKITNNLFGGATPSSQSSETIKKILINILKAFGLREETIKSYGIDTMNFNDPITGLGMLAISGIVNIANLQTQFSSQSIIPFVGILVTSIILQSNNFDVYSIAKFIGTFGSTVSNFATSIGSFLSVLLNVIGGGQAGGASVVMSNPISQFAQFLYLFANEMLARPIIKSMINSIRSYITSNGSTELKTTEGFAQELTNTFNAALGKIRSGKVSQQDILSGFKFDKETNEIKYTGKLNTFKMITTLIESSPKKIEMVTSSDGKIKYLIDSVEITGKSIIDGKQIDLALVIAYIQAKIPKTSILPKPIYSFSLESNGSVKLFENGNEISTVEQVIQSTDSTKQQTYIQGVCQNLFGIKTGLSDPTCSSYFYSAIGKSVEGILKTFGGVSHDVHGQIVSANLGILYDLLKRLGWSTRLNLRREYELITVEEWESTVGKRFIEYLKTNPQVRNLLVRIVDKLNSNPSFLNLRYNFETSISQKTKKSHTSKTKSIINSRLVTLGETLALNVKPKTVLSGGAKLSHPLEVKYLEIVGKLKSYNQKLNSSTDEKIRDKIKKIIELEIQLDKINTNILTYVKMLKTNKNLRLNGKIVTLDEIESMLSTQSKINQAHNKRIFSLSTAFGKLQLIVDTVSDESDKLVYHSI